MLNAPNAKNRSSTTATDRAAGSYSLLQRIESGRDFALEIDLPHDEYITLSDVR
jgi:hypothetical protein